ANQGRCRTACSPAVRTCGSIGFGCIAGTAFCSSEIVHTTWRLSYILSRLGRLGTRRTPPGITTGSQPPYLLIEIDAADFALNVLRGSPVCDLLVIVRSSGVAQAPSRRVFSASAVQRGN